MEQTLQLQDNRNKDYYKVGGKIIFTAHFHLKRGSCCNNGCKHCPYKKKSKKLGGVIEKFISLPKNIYTMKFQPNGNWILIPDPTKTKTESGIILGEAAAKAQSTNVLTVLKVGPDCKFVKEEDVILVDPRTEAVRSAIGDTNYLLIQEFQVLGIIF